MSEHVRGRVAPAKVLLVACFGAFLAFLDATIVNVAFPSIRESFPEASIGALSWVLNAYNIVFAAFLVVCGRLTDLIGRRRAYAGGIVLFTLASLWCAVAGNLELLDRGPGAPGARRGDAGARPPSPSSWRRSPATGGPTPSGCGERRPPWPRASGRRWAGRWSSSAAGAGPS